MDQLNENGNGETIEHLTHDQVDEILNASFSRDEGWLNVDLSGKSIESKYHFSRADLREGQFQYGFYPHTKFVHCDLRNADFSNSSLIGVTFHECDLRGAIFFRANLSNARFHGNNNRGVSFHWASMVNTDLSGNIWMEACFDNAMMHKADFKRAETNGTFLDVDAHMVDFRGANLSDSHKNDGKFRHCLFHDAKLRQVWAERCIFLNSDFTRADLRGGKFKQSHFNNAYLNKAILNGAGFQGADFDGVKLDFAAWPLECGSFQVKADDRLVCQLIAHLTRLDLQNCTPRVRDMVENIRPWANEFCRYRDDVLEVGADGKPKN